jgi:protein-disulfide isomerase
MDKRFLGILAVIVVIFVGIFAFSQNSGNKSGSTGNSSTQPTHHVTGQGKSGVTLMEYGDYQCPICEIYYKPLKDATAQYSSDIYFQFRNLPLSAIHPNAFAGARAAEAASLRGKFWQMHDKLYENQSAWDTQSNPQPTFENFAKQIGLNVDQFKQDYSSSEVNDAINADLAAFNRTGKEKATPTFFLNGVYIANDNFIDPQTGGPTADKIGQVLKAAIDKKKQ